MIKLLVQFKAPLSSVILMIFGSAFYTTFLTLLLKSQGYQSQEIGLVQSSYFLGMFVGGFRMEKIIKKVGHVQALTVFGSLATAATLLQALLQSFPAFILLRFLSGLSLAAIYIVIESWMLHHSNLKTRGVVIALYMMTIYFGQSMSQQVLRFVDITSYTPFIFSALFTSLSVIPVGLSSEKIPILVNQETFGFKEIFKISPTGVFGAFVSGLALSAVYSFFPLFAISRQVPSENLMSIIIAGGVLLQWPIGKLSDYFERRLVLLAVVAMAIILTIANFFYTGTNPYIIYTFAFCVGGFLFTLYPLCVTQVCDHLDETKITAATAFLLIAYGFGSVAGPIISSFAIEGFGINFLFIYFSVFLSTLLIIGLVTKIGRPVIPQDEQTEFVPVFNNTPISCELDPRGE